MDDAFNHLALEEALDVAMAHIDMRRWGMSARVFAWIRTTSARSRDGWAATRLDQLAELLGSDRRYVDKLLRRMTEGERCLVRERPFGERLGRAPARYAPNPCLAAWAVPWTRPHEIVMGRLGYQRGLDGYVVARSYSAPQAAVVARFSPGSARHSDSVVARSEGGFSRHNDSVVARSTTRHNSADSGPSLLSTTSVASAPSSLAQEGGSQEEVDREQAGVEAVCAALFDRGADRVEGGLLFHVRQLVRRYGETGVVSLVRQAPLELMAPRTMRWVETELREGVRPLPAVTFAEDCPECGGVTWVIDEAGDGVPCPQCRG